MSSYFTFQWHITDECDQRCRHCYIFSEDSSIPVTEMSYESMERVVSNCQDMCKRLNRTPYLYITGGDPILHPDFWNLCGLLKEKQIDFGIMGNPFHLNDEVCRRLASHGCKKYQLSLDGMRKTHDMFRKPGSFDTTIEKIDCIKKSGMYCAVMSTVSSVNMDEFPDLIDLVVEKEVDVFAFGRYCPTSGQKNEEYHIEPLQYRKFLETCWEKYTQHEGCHTYFQLKDHLWTLFLYEKGLFEIPEDAHDGIIYDGCHCGTGHMTILPDGSVYACRRMESRIGNVLKAPLYDLFLSAEMDSYRDFSRFKKCNKCELKGFCRGCPAVTYGYTGSMYDPDPQCWKEISA